MSNGSQQATKAAPKHTHNDRHLSECQNKQVLRRPIFFKQDISFVPYVDDGILFMKDPTKCFSYFRRNSK